MPDPNESVPLEFRRRADAARTPRAAALHAARERNSEAGRLAARESDRARFWFAVRIAFTCVGGCLLGFVPMAWALHTTDVEAGRIAWAAGPVLGQAIVLTTLVYGALRWARDDW